ncbi:possible ATP-dependent helicase (plasmid) [Rhodococcus jostii RHA1]|uniref:Possible ATP-dependent helicase n=1 Tax=Rhodococcus jostii (strain RHA1) TaxID=101510 RepID=Q0RUT7_RHOJR|nr:possible ATP-dependent helicase [Rhodococcus jostii RHA1]
MPRYKFKWSNLPPSLLHDLCRELLDAYDQEVGAAVALQTVYGARPTVEFVREAWPTLRESWLRTAKESRDWIVEALQEARHERGLLKGSRAQLAYLRDLRNSRTLREIVWAELVAIGEMDRQDEQDHAGTIEKPPTQAPARPREKDTPQCRPEERDAKDAAGIISRNGPRLDEHTRKWVADVSTTLNSAELPVLRPAAELNVAPGSIVVVRDEEWLVTQAEQGSDGWLVRVRGLSELVADTTAAFYSSLDDIEVLDPAQAQVVADASAGYRNSRLWLEALLRKTPVPYGDQSLTVSTHMLADSLAYQRTAVAKALDPQHIRPRILIADAVGLGKTLEIGMILSELVRRGRGERILVVTPKHVLEQMQHELWCRFALPFVRLDSAGIQKVRQKLPATRNPFTYFKRAIISIDTLKSPR